MPQRLEEVSLPLYADAKLQVEVVYFCTEDMKYHLDQRRGEVNMPHRYSFLEHYVYAGAVYRYYLLRLHEPLDLLILEPDFLRRENS